MKHIEAARGNWDKGKIEQVIINLLTNAIKYGEGKPVHVSVKSFNGGAELEVEDEGMGIPADKHKKIFERFERAVSANTVSGLGLGLFIVKEIILAHDGHISVESEVGLGSCFKVFLPYSAT